MRMDCSFQKDLFFVTTYLYSSPFDWDIERGWYNNFDEDTVFDCRQCWDVPNYL